MICSDLTTMSLQLNYRSILNEKAGTLMRYTYLQLFKHHLHIHSTESYSLKLDKVVAVNYVTLYKYFRSFGSNTLMGDGTNGRRL